MLSFNSLFVYYCFQESLSISLSLTSLSISIPFYLCYLPTSPPASLNFSSSSLNSRCVSGDSHVCDDPLIFVFFISSAPVSRLHASNQLWEQRSRSGNMGTCFWTRVKVPHRAASPLKPRVKTRLKTSHPGSSACEPGLRPTAGTQTGNFASLIDPMQTLTCISA